MPLSRPVDSEAKLRATSFRVTLMLAATGLALLIVIIYAGLSMNRSAWQYEHARVDAELTEIVNQTLMEQKPWAFWDEAALFAHHGRIPRKWFEEQVAASLVEGYRHEQIYLLDPKDRVIHGYGRGRRLTDQQLKALWPSIRPMLHEIRTGIRRPYIRRDAAFGSAQKRYEKLSSARSGRWAANILKDGGRPVIVSIMTITPTTEARLASDRPHLLLSVVPLDQQIFDAIGRHLDLEGLKLTPTRRGNPGAIPFVTDDGRTAGMLAWTAATPGEPMFTRILPLFAILLAVALFYARLVLRRLRDTHSLLYEQEAHSRFLALHDGLSQLPNRRHFMTELRRKLERLAESESPHRLCVAYVDVDRFKDVNDVIGHGAGDALVTQIGPRLKTLLGPDDLLARLGGDEFAILKIVADGDGQRLLGEAIISAFTHPFLIEGHCIEVTASVGIAVAHPSDAEPEGVLRDADISLYKAKEEGRNRYVLFKRGMADEIHARRRTEGDLRTAIGTEQICIEYQPLISTRTGRVSAFEALARWQHPSRGMIPPLEFIPIAEQGGLMLPLGDHILEKVFREAAAFDGVELAINLSPIQLRQRRLPDRLDQLARRFSVDPGKIILEITESMLLQADEVTSEIFDRLRRSGFRLALDDFGTGYSSLGYLGRFAFDKIKIDRSFISSSSMETLRPILEGIVHIGRGLRVDVVAEGIESAEELAMVQALGCNEAQGYYISRPMPITSVPAFLASERTPIERPKPPRLARG